VQSARGCSGFLNIQRKIKEFGANRRGTTPMLAKHKAPPFGGALRLKRDASALLVVLSAPARILGLLAGLLAATLLLARLLVAAALLMLATLSRLVLAAMLARVVLRVLRILVHATSLHLPHADSNGPQGKMFRLSKYP
jgi:hypothetical protein